MSDVVHPLGQGALPRIPVFLARVAAGFPSPAEDYLEDALNLHEFAVKHPAATFFWWVSGDSMEPTIHSGDLLVVDRSLVPAQDGLVLGVVDGALTVKRLHTGRGGITLIPDNPRYAPLEIRDPARFTLWGVVTHALHDFLRRR